MSKKSYPGKAQTQDESPDDSGEPTQEVETSPELLAASQPTQEVEAQAVVDEAPVVVVEPAKPVEKAHLFLRVASKSQGGFWRCKRHFTTKPEEIPLEDLTKAELEELEHEPALNVALIEK